MTWQTKSTGSADTVRLGEALGNLIRGGEVIELRAELGGGKTTFVRGLARGLSSKDTVSSPTFTLSKIYKCRNDLELHHFDFYRLTEPGVVAEQLVESLESKDVIAVVEWSNIVKNVLPEDRLEIELKLAETDPDERTILVHYPEAKAGLIKAVQASWTEVEP